MFLFVNDIIILKMTGVRAFVTPPPRLPQPAAVALAAPTCKDLEAMLLLKLTKSTVLLRAALAAGSAPNQTALDMSLGESI